MALAPISWTHLQRSRAALFQMPGQSLNEHLLKEALDILQTLNQDDSREALKANKGSSSAISLARELTSLTLKGAKSANISSGSKSPAQAEDSSASSKASESLTASAPRMYSSSSKSVTLHEPGGFLNHLRKEPYRTSNNSEDEDNNEDRGYDGSDDDLFYKNFYDYDDNDSAKDYTACSADDCGYCGHCDY